MLNIRVVWPSFWVGAWWLALTVFAAQALPPCAAGETHFGPDRPLKALVSGVAVVSPYDRIRVDPGVYTDATLVLTIEGRSGVTSFRVTRPISHRKGILVTSADLTVRHPILQGAIGEGSDGRNGAFSRRLRKLPGDCWG